MAHIQGMQGASIVLTSFNKLGGVNSAPSVSSCDDLGLSKHILGRFSVSRVLKAALLLCALFLSVSCQKDDVQPSDVSRGTDKEQSSADSTSLGIEFDEAWDGEIEREF